MGDPEPQSAEQKLADLAVRMGPRILERVAELERISGREDLEPAEIEAARVEAHKLRGLLGTIGLPEGSERAGEVEDLLAQGSTAIAEPLARLRTAVEPG